MSETISLREYIESRLRELERRVDATNEIRGQLTDQASRYATRDQVDSLDKLVQELRVIGGTNIGRSGGLNSSWGYVIGAVGLAVGLVSIIMALRSI